MLIFQAETDVIEGEKAEFVGERNVVVAVQ
jgi:hypothetical protein